MRRAPGTGRWLRLVLGALYTAMAAAQLVSLSRMPGILGAYGLVHGAAATVLALGLIAGEAVCGVWFLARPRSHAPAPVWVYTAVSLVWGALAFPAWVRGLTVANCGCFGRFLAQPMSWITLTEDALTLVYAAVLLRGVRAAQAVE